MTLYVNIKQYSFLTKEKLIKHYANVDSAIKILLRLELKIQKPNH